MCSRHPREPRGFTLIEVLVALAIVAIALLAAMRAAQQGTSNVEALRARLLGAWVADNRLSEHRARGAWLPVGTVRGQQQQAGIVFQWREEVSATANPNFRRVDILVFTGSDEAHAVARLTGFLLQSQAQPR